MSMIGSWFSLFSHNFPFPYLFWRWVDRSLASTSANTLKLVILKLTEITVEDLREVLELFCGYSYIVTSCFKKPNHIVMLSLRFMITLTTETSFSKNIRGAASLIVLDRHKFHFFSIFKKKKEILCFLKLSLFLSSFWPSWWANCPPRKALATPLKNTQYYHFWSHQLTHTTKFYIHMVTAVINSRQWIHIMHPAYYHSCTFKHTGSLNITEVHTGSMKTHLLN